MRVLGVALLCSLFGACAGTFTIPTAAHVARYEGPRLIRYCVITLGWDRDELLEKCGEPVARVERVGAGDRGCWIYGSIARPITAYVAPDTRFFAACFAEKRMSRTPVLIVDEVIGLSAAPPGLEVTPSDGRVGASTSSTAAH